MEKNTKHTNKKKAKIKKIIKKKQNKIKKL